MKKSVSRRRFIKQAAAGSAAFALIRSEKAPMAIAQSTEKPALLGGQAIRTAPWPPWPTWKQEWEAMVTQVLRSGRWWRGRGEHVENFEIAYAKLIGTQRCLATASGTTALLISLHVLDVDAGDEVVVSPYTFIATYNSILMNKALPVFADTDPETYTLNPTTIESRITDRTRAIMPVHIFGLPCEMDAINAIAKKRNLVVIEDACQAWLAEYKGRKCGALGDLGCFSFQNSKHLPTGEGGAITGNDETILDRCHSFHNCGRAYGTCKGDQPYFTRGSNRRMQQVSAVMLLQQLDKLQADTARRRDNAEYLRNTLQQIPGIRPAKLPENSRPVWHLFPFRYDSNAFKGLTRDAFVKALNAEGIPCSIGYQEQYFDGIIDEAIQSRGYKRLFSEKRLKEYRDSLQELKGNRLLCETTVAFTQNLLLSEKKDMDDIVNAIRKIQANSEPIARASAKS